MADRKTSRSEDIKNRFRTLFSRSGGIGGNNSPTGTPPPSPAGTVPPALSDEMLRDMGQGSTLILMQRIELIQAAREAVASRESINSKTLITLWLAVNDLANEKDIVAKEIVWLLMIDLMKHQPWKIGALLESFYSTIRENISCFAAEVGYKITALSLLTDEGKCQELVRSDFEIVLFQLMQEACKWNLTEQYVIVVELMNSALRHNNDDWLSIEYRILMIKHVCSTCRCMASANRTGHSNEHIDFEPCLRLVINLLGNLSTSESSPSPILQTAEASLTEMLRCACFLTADKQLYQLAWELAERLLSQPKLETQLLEELRLILTDSSISDVLMVRGAVFVIGMALWGKHSIPNVSSPGNTRLVLRSLLTCLQRDFDGDANHSSEVAREKIRAEVMLSVARLLKKHHDFLTADPEQDENPEDGGFQWRIIVEMMEHLVGLYLAGEMCGSTTSCVGDLAALLTNLEILHKQHEVPVCHEARLIDLFEACRNIISDDSIMYWMKLRIEIVFQLTPPDQLNKLREVIYMYHIRETRESVRLQAICLLISHYSRLHSFPIEVQFSLLEEITGALFDHFESIEEGDPVRLKLIQLFIVCIDEVDRIPCDESNEQRKTLIIRYGNFLTSILQEGRIESAEVESVVHEFIRIFMRTWQKNGVLQVCVRVFNQMLGLLQKLYFDRPINLKTLKKDEVTRIRDLKVKLFTFFLDFRCCKDHTLDHYSRISKEPSHLFFQKPLNAENEYCSRSPLKTAQLCFQWVFKMLLQALQKELDWVVLRLVIEKLALHLDIRHIIVNFPDMITSASVSLCAMICERQLCFPEKLYDGPRLQQFHAHVLVPLTRLVSYAYLMDRARQRQLIDCLCFGLVSSYNRECIGALTLALLEMPEAMKSVLTSIVLKLSQIASKPAISAYVLEFLSTLVHLPDLYRNFSEEGYLSIFAVAVPYTNPFRFNNYIVATAYRLIIAWFVKCRQPFRKTFANFIIKGLQSHVTRNFEEHERVENRRPDLSSITNAMGGRSSLESSMNEQRRSRGKSLNVGFKLRGSRGKTSVGVRSPGPQQNENEPSLTSTVPHVNSTIKHISPPLMRKSCSVAVAPSATVAACLHKELTEVCADMLARFAFSSVATMPRRSHIVEKLLEGGPKQSWLVGPAQVVTVQTCQDFAPGREGLCSRCEALFGPDDEEVKTPPPSPPPFLRSVESSPPPVHEENLCWCSGLAEVTVHRPSGIVSWICRLQNPQISLEGASTSSPSALPLEIAHLYRRTSLATETPILTDYIKEVQYEELHRQQFTDHPVSSTSTVDRDSHTTSAAVPVRKSGLASTRARLIGGSAEDVSPVESIPGDLARSPSMPDLSPGDHEKSDDEEVGLDGDLRNRSTTMMGVPNEKQRITSRPPLAVPRKRRSITHGSSYGLNPSFVFLQLYYSHAFGNPDKDVLRPLPLPEKSDQIVAFSVGQLSEVPTYEMHSIGVIYVGEGQANDESAIFANQRGSDRYHEFLSRLGQPINLSHCDSRKQYVGGLDTKHGEDGEWTVVWNDDIIQLAFHVTTLMPPATSPANKHNKKRHVGNDYVTVVYNDSGDEYKLGTITGQFQFVNVVVEPLCGNYNRVLFITRDNGVADLLGSLHPRLVSDQALGRFIRVSALHANLASLILTRQRLDPASPFSNCWLERLRRMRRLRNVALKAMNQQKGGDAGGVMERFRPEISEDFTDIVH